MNIQSSFASITISVILPKILTINLFVIFEPISPNVMMNLNGLVSKIFSGELEARYPAGTSTNSRGIIGVITLVP